MTKPVYIVSKPRPHFRAPVLQLKIHFPSHDMNTVTHVQSLAEKIININKSKLQL